MVHRTLRQYDIAKEYLYQSLAIHRETHQLNGEALSLWHLALPFAELGDLDQARRNAEQAVALFQTSYPQRADMIRKQLADWASAAKHT